MRCRSCCPSQLRTLPPVARDADLAPAAIGITMTHRRAHAGRRRNAPLTNRRTNAPATGDRPTSVPKTVIIPITRKPPVTSRHQSIPLTKCWLPRPGTRRSWNGRLWNVRSFPASVRLDAGELDHLGPLLGFIGDMLGELHG